MQQPDPVQLHEIVSAVIVTGVTVVGLVWTIMWAYTRSLRGDMKDVKDDREKCASTHDRHIVEIKARIHDHHENTKVHRVPDRERAQFEALNNKIDSNRSTLVEIKSAIVALNGTLQGLAVEVKRQNGR